MNRPVFYSVLTLALGFLAMPRLHAQSAAGETLQQNVVLRTETQAPPPVVSSGSDLGDVDAVQQFPKPEMFTLSTTQQFFYTDNVFYTNANQVASTGYLGSYTGSFVPYSMVNWTPRISLQYNMVRYGNAAEGDFDNENVAFSNQYIFSDDRAWAWTPSITLSRFTAPNPGEFYKEVLYDSQISHSQQLCENLYFVAAYGLSYHQADPAEFDRLDNTLSFTFAYYILPTLRVSTYVRPSLRTYYTNTDRQHDRDDINISEGLDLTWDPCKYASFSANVLHTNDYSNNSGRSYNNTAPGISVTGTLKF